MSIFAIIKEVDAVEFSRKARILQWIIGVNLNQCINVAFIIRDIIIYIKNNRHILIYLLLTAIGIIPFVLFYILLEYNIIAG